MTITAIQVDAWRSEVDSLRMELREAKAEIERLQDQCITLLQMSIDREAEIIRLKVELEHK